jgi:hypothetical protein
MKRVQFFLHSARAATSLLDPSVAPSAAEKIIQHRPAMERRSSQDQAMHLVEFAYWKFSYDVLLYNLNKKDKKDNQKLNGTLPTVLLHYKTYLLILTTALAADGMIFDSPSFISTFSEIIALAAKLDGLIGTRSRNVNFNFDTGSIFQLYIVALKCRAPSLKREAIELLASRPRREGIWDSVFAAKVTE